MGDGEFRNDRFRIREAGHRYAGDDAQRYRNKTEKQMPESCQVKRVLGYLFTFCGASALYQCLCGYISFPHSRMTHR